MIEVPRPPTLDFGEQFVAFHTPVQHPPPSLIEQWPIVALPQWIFCDSADRWHVILYAGASMNRHVNDIEFLYRTLVNVYLIPRENITVLSYDGTLAYNNANWERYTGTIEPWPGENRTATNSRSTEPARERTCSPRSRRSASGSPPTTISCCTPTTTANP